MKKLEKGFTLIELMIVVAIIAILAAVAAPKFGSQIKKSRDAKALELVGVWRSALNLDYADSTTGVYAADFGDLADNVDGQTLSKTFQGTTQTTAVSTASTNTQSNTNAGNPTTVTFSITTTAIGATSESSIVFDAGQTMTDGTTAWNTK